MNRPDGFVQVSRVELGNPQYLSGAIGTTGFPRTILVLDSDCRVLAPVIGLAAGSAGLLTIHEGGADLGRFSSWIQTWPSRTPCSCAARRLPQRPRPGDVNRAVTRKWWETPSTLQPWPCTPAMPPQPDHALRVVDSFSAARASSRSGVSKPSVKVSNTCCSVAVASGRPAVPASPTSRVAALS